MQPSVRRTVAVRPKFDQEHCEGCETLVSRGSLRNVQVVPEPDRKSLKPAMFKALCRTCLRKSA